MRSCWCPASLVPGVSLLSPHKGPWLLWTDGQGLGSGAASMSENSALASWVGILSTFPKAIDVTASRAFSCYLCYLCIYLCPALLTERDQGSDAWLLMFCFDLC